MVVINPNTMADGPIDVIHNGVRLHLQPGESPRQAMQRQAELAMAQPAPKAAEPDRRAAQDRNTEAMKALAKETAELRAAVDAQAPAEPKPAAPPSQPEPKRTGFAAKVKFGGGFRAIGGKHEQRSHAS